MTYFPFFIFWDILCLYKIIKWTGNEKEREIPYERKVLSQCINPEATGASQECF